jgi:hypothetical protein
VLGGLLRRLVGNWEADPVEDPDRDLGGLHYRIGWGHRHRYSRKSKGSKGHGGYWKKPSGYWKKPSSYWWKKKSPAPTEPPTVSPTPAPTPEPTGYRRVLTEYSLEGRDRELFDLMEGEELERHLSAYEDKKDKQTSLGLCDFPGSVHHGKDATHQECFDPANQMSSDQDQNNGELENYEPWIIPSTEGGILLAANPGIWSFESFLKEDEIDRLLKLVNKYGNDLQMFGPCKHEKRHPSNAHPMEGKVCFKISPEHVCDGPYDISDCALKTDLEDAAFMSDLLSKFKDMWPIGVDPYPYAKFQLARGGTPPVDLHMDNEKIVSFVLYLTDGGASMIFPSANVSVTPKKGTAHTWLNMYEDGSRNPMSDHAVQAHPANAGERLVMLFEIPTGLKYA